MAQNFNYRESFLGQVFNFKLGRFVVKHRKFMVCNLPLLELKNRPGYHKNANNIFLQTLKQNRLECLQFFHPSLIYVVRLAAYLEWECSTSVRRNYTGLKVLETTNALAYCGKKGKVPELKLAEVCLRLHFDVIN